jgi:hypothetical protein
MYEEVLRKSAKEPPITTHFIDSTNLISPFMNSKKTASGFELVRGINFMGRSGIKIIKGLRVGFISGIDFYVLSTFEH